MTFEDHEQSVETGGRIELYTLAIGTSIWRMHDTFSDVIPYAGDDYFKAIISRGRIATGQEHLTVKLPADHEFSNQFTTIAPGQLGTLTIRAYHRADDTDVRVIYKGVVRSVAFTRDMSQSLLSVVPVSEAFDKAVPQRTFQSSCNNVLFDADCKVSSGSFKHTNIVTAVAGNVVTVQALLSTKGDGWATAGFASYGVLDYRLILTQDGDDCILALPFYADVSGKTIDVFAGCEHVIAVCESKFGNRINFGGCPYVPTKNIFATGL